MSFSSILRNKHFNNLSAIVRVAYLSKSWKSKHPEVPFWSLSAKAEQAVVKQLDIQDALTKITDLLAKITTADHRLSYTTDDLEWLVSVADNKDWTTLHLLVASWSAPCDMLTTKQLSSLLDTSISNWRNKAQAGHIAGAVRRGATWLLPVPVLLSMGVLPYEFKNQTIIHEGKTLTVDIGMVRYKNNDTDQTVSITGDAIYQDLFFKLKTSSLSPFASWEVIQFSNMGAFTPERESQNAYY